MRNYVGIINGRLLVVDTVKVDNKTKLMCKCECGNEVVITAGNLPKTSSCGCLKKEIIRKRLLKEVNVGDRHGYLVIKNEVHGTKRRSFLCQCDCGKETIVTLSDLTTGNTKSCGCKPMLSMVSKHRLYSTWYNMISRCENANDKDYPNYGGRGIEVCSKWKDAKIFCEDMYPSFQEGLTLDRIDNNGNYSKENCRWATRKEQCNNTRRNVYVMIYGEKYSVMSISKMHDLTYSCVLTRLAKGENGEIITRRSRKRKK